MEILQDDTMRELYNASLNGCVSSLRILIQRDPLILSKVSLHTFSETPLHIASLLGNLEFCQILLDIDPNLAAEVNSEGRCPLHLASSKGYTEIVRALLLTNAETCLIRDKDDKLPLHFAAMRGRVEAIKELNSVMPETETIRIMSETDDHGSVLHLCVRYNHLEALKILVQSVRGDNRLQFLSAKDKGGNNILHLAVRRTQIKVLVIFLK
jgi:ankyrin repeat protein